MTPNKILSDEKPYTAGETTPRSPYEAPEEEKKKYRFHKLSSVSLHHHTLICTFLVDLDPSSIFYTPFEEGKEPVREYEVGEVEKENIEIMPDALAVRVGELFIPSEEIYTHRPKC